MELDVVFRNDCKQKLIGTLTLPEGKDKVKGVVLCHGFMSDRNSFYHPATVKACEAAGIATLRFDLHGCGESEGDYHPTYRTIIDDLKTAIRYLKGHERIEDVAVCGHSMGGTAAICVAREEEVSAIITYGAVAYPDLSAERKRKTFTKVNDHYTYDNGKHSARFNEDWFEDAQHCEPVGVIKQLTPPKLIIHGTEDRTISMDEATALFIHAKLPKSFKRIEGADHWGKGKEKEIAEAVARFLSTHQGYLQDR